ncbi:MAG: hypothetical protein M1819_006430 [Sarea resinae]|nr:MAG: hypothetical protein M1819_006430 [Sarea resinae]
MPNRNKRNLEEFDPNKSDSDDSTYSASPSKPKRARSVKGQTRKPFRKRQRRTYRADGSEDESEEALMSEESYEEDVSEEAEPEHDPVTGRPKRRSVKKGIKYEESDSNSEEFLQEVGARESDSPKRSKLILKLNLPTKDSTPERVARGSSAGRGMRRGTTADATNPGTRRSSRIAHDEQETIVALTESGRHAQILRHGTHSPDSSSRRPTRGDKGVRLSGPRTVIEVEEGDDTRTLASNNTQSVQPAEEVQHGVVEAGLAACEYADNLIAKTDTQNATQGDSQNQQDVEMGDGATIADSAGEAAPEDDEDEDDEEPISARGRATRSSRVTGSQHSTRRSQRPRKRENEESSDFEPNAEEGADDDMSSSEHSAASPKKSSQKQDEGNESSNSRRSGRLGKGRSGSSARNRQTSASEHESDIAEELAEEIEDLRSSPRKRSVKRTILYEEGPKLRGRKEVDYRIWRPDLALPGEDAEAAPATTPTRRGRGGGGSWQRSLFSTYGPFGGAGGPAPVLGGPGGIGAAGGVDSDSSDDDAIQRPRRMTDPVGMTPTSAMPQGFLPSAQAHGTDAGQMSAGNPSNLGKIKDKQALADADPLGVDQNVNFDSVGGLQGHIDQLKEMVSLPLLYPEIFTRFHVTPPRGVLFHGPPGTGKTLLARALASSVSSQGRKVTFYMRKGADALSKWVGEAERQLRLLFEEARKTQPSIIFFDEIDGLAPVRSSKQEQIHASIVSTLLALMDGMDGRGQVVVIGATNRPDSIDPALRRPGRFDREFYFPLPDKDARRSIIDIHTRGWDPPLDGPFKDQLAEITKGYGGADLRALCTEAALNAVQRRYPQIYKSNEKLIIDPSTIKITAKDFMISVAKIVPSSERSTTSVSSALPKSVEPLLREPLSQIKLLLDEILPRQKKLTALEEAQFEDAQDDGSFQRERMQQEFERSRVFRPRLLLRGAPGMGQSYIAGALLHHFEGLHVQPFDLPTLLSDSTRSPEAAVVQLFSEVRRRKPSVIYIPNVDTWYRDMAGPAISAFLSLLRSLPPSEPVLLLGVIENDGEDMDKLMIKDLFGYSKKNQFALGRPKKLWRLKYFETVINYIRTSPNGFPDPVHRKRRKLEQLEVAPQPKIAEGPSKEEKKAQKRKDRQTLNMLKLRLQPIMDQIKQRYKKFRTGVIEESQIRYLYDDEDPDMVSTDLPQQQRQQRPYEKDSDDKGVPGLLETATNRFFYNLETVTIERRLSNGFYKRSKDFLADIKRLAKDAKTIGDSERTLKANEMLSNVEVDIGFIDAQDPGFVNECEQVHFRETERERDLLQRSKQDATTFARDRSERSFQPSLGAREAPGAFSEQSSGPIMLGEPVPGTSSLTPSGPLQQGSFSNGDMLGDMLKVTNAAEVARTHVKGNDSSAPSGDDVDGDDDVAMADSDQHKPHDHERGNKLDSLTEVTNSSDFSRSGHIQPAAMQKDRSGVSSWANPSGATTERSQKSAITHMPPGSQIEDFANDASTTTSGKKTSDHSNRSSGPYYTTQSSNGLLIRGDGPNYASIPENGSGDSQLPETQGKSIITTITMAQLTSNPDMMYSQGSNPPSNPGSSQSQPRSQLHSQPPVPQFSASSQHQPSGSISSILNTPDEALIIEEGYVANLLEEIARGTSGCSIEQLEQINSALMECIWLMRGEWNRTKVAREVSHVFNAVIADMEELQDFQPASLATRED